MGPVTAIVLAAGASERMGEQKLAMRLGSGTILDATLGAVTASRVGRVVVVTAPGAVPPLVGSEGGKTGNGAPVVVVENPDPARGNMSSLRAGTDADDGASAFVVVPGDLPTIATATIDAMVDLWTAERPWAAVTEYVDRIAHPFLLSRAAVGDIGSADGTKVLWQALVEPSNPRVVRVPVDTGAPLDVNTPSDYDALVATWRGER
jgi:molybdenum cofactor cytidylyltransferase